MADEDDEDWFEQAFEDETPDDEPTDGSPPDESDDAESDADDPSSDESTGEPTDDSRSGDAESDSSPSFDAESDSPPEPATGDDAPPEPATGDDENDADAFADAFGGGDPAPNDGDDGDLFEDDFADAFAGGSGGAPAPGGGGGGGENFGFDLDGDTGGGAPGGFEEEEEYDSDIPRIDVGIDGLDEMIQGGLPERSLMVAIGEAGTGKTTFGLQFLHEAIENGERAVFITLEESRERVVQSATDKGWEFERHAEEGNLAVIDIDPIEMANSLTSIRNELPRLVEEFGASRLVLDSVSLLEMMYDDQSKRRTEIYDFTKSLKDAGVTTMLTSEASEDSAFASRFGIIEYLTDAVVVLRYIRPEDFRETRLAVEIQKIRDANHSRETKPYEITHQGISVYRQANIF
ncbi:KaiC domain-containing protein [Halobacterium litoreum]|uniref:KaiC domain-containing protein n=1 Tax=Halobacterium litoreum TaxID=2039234 RepID=A0ABD5NDD8_9EURY